MRLIGLDIGTTGCKACLFESSGELLARASREYPVDIPHPGWAEQDAEKVWRLAKESLGEVMKSSGRQEVAAIGLSVQGEAVMPLDETGRALRPMILGMDTRTDAQNDWLVEKFGSRTLFEKTGMPVHTINTLPKLLWIRQREPEVWRAASRFVLYEDFLTLRMTNKAAISKCLASRTQLYDLPEDRWSEEILDALELTPDQLSPALPSGTPVGSMRDELADELGFPRPPLVVTGGHDQACGALGVGLTRPGLSMVSTGTAEVVEVVLDRPELNETLRRGNISVYNHVVPGLFLAMTLNHSGGMVLRWFRDALCAEETAQAQESGQDPYDRIFQDFDPGPSPVIFLPHLGGSGTPHLDTASKGLLAGITFATSKKDIAKAILEGLTFELRYNLEILEQGQVAIDELRAIGGGARSRTWLKMKADITGVPVTAPQITEAASWGAAVLGGVGAGCYANPMEGVEKSVNLVERYTGDPALHEQYQARYALYQQLYPGMKAILHAI
ncbi:MAG: FGGY family carbohydrate kinase [Chloroflexi bacterium]|nr:FGGY family carbohydrate kinase [Chloroflexota bacterium]